MWIRYLLSSSENMIEAVPLLMLSECIEQCRQNASCHSINYETGLCVLFTSHADKLPGKAIMILQLHIFAPRSFTMVQRLLCSEKRIFESTSSRDCNNYRMHQWSKPNATISMFIASVYQTFTLSSLPCLRDVFVLTSSQIPFRRRQNQIIAKIKTTLLLSLCSIDVICLKKQKSMKK